MRNPQRSAELWHWAATAIAGALLGWEIVGLVGHYRLRKPYRRWHESRLAVA